MMNAEGVGDTSPPRAPPRTTENISRSRCTRMLRGARDGTETETQLAAGFSVRWPDFTGVLYSFVFTEHGENAWL